MERVKLRWLISIATRPIIRACNDINIMIESPDVFICTAAMNACEFFEGRGDRTTFFNMILEGNPGQIPDLARKLKLVTRKEYLGLTLYNDKMSRPDRVNKQMIFRLWLHCCRKNGVLTLEDMIEFQPHAKEQLVNYDLFVDEEGKTTLNQEKH